MKMDFDIPKETSSIIKVIGVGGGGGNAVNHMYSEGIKGVEFLVCNTDLQALKNSPVPHKIQLGPSLTEGRGAGSLPEIGKNAAIENIDEIKEYLEKDAKMVFVTAGMGGGTGTGAAPVIAEIAKELGILTVGIVTVPFNFEGKRRREQAEEGLEEMRKNVDTLLVINNERLREITGNLPIGSAFSQADNILATAAKGIAEVIENTGAINVDFNDVNTVMKNSGVAIMGSAVEEGDDRAIKAVKAALESPLLNDNDISGAEYVLLNITYGDREVLMDEITEITDYIQESAGSTADVIFGHAKDDSLGDKISVTVIATGFKKSPITGFETAPKKEVATLHDVAKEIKEPLDSPTDNTLTIIEATKEDKSIIDESNGITEENEVRNLDWDFSNEGEETNPVEKEEEIITRVTLEDDKEELMDLEGSASKHIISAEEQEERRQDRLSRIQKYTERLKNSDNIQELENEPAYVRRNIELDSSMPSESDNNSKFSVTKSEDGTSLNSNNSFLHDNVD
ncbi:MAG: cell division protein FtsZ [Crocinitomicaceae bacterium]|nr:cell division protein FtsZ [Crocinitomicaceae bacterium]